jgi:hypothetical protein
MVTVKSKIVLQFRCEVGCLQKISSSQPNYFNINRTNNYYEQRNAVNIPKLKRLLADIDHTLSIECFNNVAAQWNFETNVNEVTQVEAVSKNHKIKKEIY